MPQTAWNAKRERQYQHIRKGLVQHGRTEGTAEEIAARTVNKERAQHGEARTASRATLADMPASKRGGEHSHLGAKGRTYAQLYEDARRARLPGRSRMTKAELERALKR